MGEIDVSGVAPSPYIDTDVERNGPDVRAALPDHLRLKFEEEFRAALAKAAETFDLAPVQEVIDGWWGHAVIYTTPEIFEELKGTQARIEAGIERLTPWNSSKHHEESD